MIIVVDGEPREMTETEIYEHNRIVSETEKMIEEMPELPVESEEYEKALSELGVSV